MALATPKMVWTQYPSRSALSLTVFGIMPEDVAAWDAERKHCHRDLDVSQEACSPNQPTSLMSYEKIPSARGREDWFRRSSVLVGIAEEGLSGGASFRE